MMIELSASHVRLLEIHLTADASSETVLPVSIGNTVAGGGVWRFFSDIFPLQGVGWWNGASGWREHWKSLLPAGLFCFGEDIFGNQLAMVPGHENVLLWNHEDGRLFDLLLAPAELLSTVAESGIDWIDFYGNGAPGVARNFGLVPEDSHLHWTTPLILNGAVNRENLRVVERNRHLIGHAELWLQIRGLEPGTIIHARQPGEF